MCYIGPDMQVSQLVLPEIVAAIENGDLKSLKTVFEDLHPSDVAELVNQLSSEHVASIIRLLRFPSGIHVFEQLDLQTQANVLNHLGRTETVNILEELSSDDRVDLIQKLPEQTVKTLLPFIAQTEREEIKKLLQYQEDSAGALMTTEYVNIPVDMNVKSALAHIKKVASEKETIYYVYVVDAQRRLIGTVSLRDLVLADDERSISSILSKDPIALSVSADLEEVVKTFEKYDFLAVPVVDYDMKLVGIITHDDAFDTMIEEHTEDAHRMGAMQPLEDPYFQSKITDIVRKRGFWLMLLFLGQFFTFSALQYFEATMQKAVMLMFFVPLIISSGGNSGSQSVTLITRGLAVGDVKSKDFFKVLRRETLVGLLLGLFLCVIGIVWAHFIWGADLYLCIAVGVSLISVVTFGALVGSLLPIIFKHLGQDPAIMSSPFVASIVDVIGIVIYFSVAKILLDL